MVSIVTVPIVDHVFCLDQISTTVIVDVARWDEEERVSGVVFHINHC